MKTPELTRIDISSYDKHTDYQQLYLSQLDIDLDTDSTFSTEFDGLCESGTCSITIPAQNRPTLVFAKFHFTTPLGEQIIKYFEKLVVPCEYRIESELITEYGEEFSLTFTKDIIPMTIYEVFTVKKAEVHKYCSHYAEPAPNMAVLTSLIFYNDNN